MAQSITVFNRSERKFKIGYDEKAKKHTFLEPNQSVEVPEKLAKQLLSYPGVVDASKMVKTKKAKELEKENKDLSNKLGEVEEKKAELVEKVAGLEEKIKGLAVELEAAKKKK